MSRIGKMPISIPAGVEVKIENDLIVVKGPKGTLSQKILKGIAVNLVDGAIEVALEDESNGMSNFHGLFRALIFNMVHGVTVGFEKKLEMRGVGYRAIVQGDLLDLQLGLSHPLKMPIDKDLKVIVEKNTQITVSGANKQKVGQFAASVRAKKKPEPYQGKGIRYVGEFVRKKAGKTAAKK